MPCTLLYSVSRYAGTVRQFFIPSFKNLPSRILHSSSEEASLKGMRKSKTFFYAVRTGRNAGIYNSWEECAAMVLGFSNAEHKRFETRDDAEAYLRRDDVHSTEVIETEAETEIETVVFNEEETRQEKGKNTLSLVEDEDVKMNVDDSRQNLRFNERLLAESPSIALSAAFGNLSDNCNYLPLSDEQQCVLDAVMLGENVFITGSAGVGKSFLLRYIINQFIVEKKSIVVTASTGTAAMPLNGTTLHSFARIGLGKQPAETTAMKILAAKTPELKIAKDNWKEAQILIIDEISMLSEEIMDKVNYIAKKVRNLPKAFGGLQVIACGDFYQLPPVPESRNCPKCGSTERISLKEGLVQCAYFHPRLKTRCNEIYKLNIGFAFESTAWRECNFRAFELRKVFRQEDEKFVNVLNKVRLGVHDDDVVRVLSKCKEAKVPEDSTKLYPLRREVAAENDKNFSQLKGDPYEYKAIDGCNENERVFMKQLSRGQIDDVCRLKVDAKVILVRNLSFGLGLVNGAQGKIIRFDPTMHLAQPHIPWSIKSNISAVSDWRRCLQQTPFIPFVEFQNGMKAHIFPTTWTVETYLKGVPQLHAWRIALPLKLAYALTIHKSQGMTLNHVQIRMENIFAHGQAYVALSRGRRLESIRLENFDPSVIHADPKVHAFYTQNQVLHALSRTSTAQQHLYAQSSLQQMAKREEADPLIHYYLQSESQQHIAEMPDPSVMPITLPEKMWDEIPDDDIF